MPAPSCALSDLPAALTHVADHAARLRDHGAPLWNALRSLGPALVTSPEALARLDPPEAVAQLWQRDLRTTRAANLLRLDELGRVLGASFDAGIDVALLKGAAALDTLYHDPGTRPMDDVDLLVHPGDQVSAGAVLQRLGYRAVAIDDGRLGPVGDGLHAARAFRRGDLPTSVEIDLHWQPVSDARLRAAFPGVMAPGLWSRAEPSWLAGAPVLRLDPVDAVLTTASAQLFGHPWSHPLGYLDLHLLMDRLDPAGRKELARRATERRIEAPLYWSLRFASELFGTAAEAELLGALEPAGLSRRLGERLAGADWLGLTPFRREMPARDLFVLLAAGPGGTLRMLRAGVLDREPGGARRAARINRRSSVRVAVWLAQAALQTLVQRPARG